MIAMARVYLLEGEVAGVEAVEEEEEEEEAEAVGEAEEEEAAEVEAEVEKVEGEARAEREKEETGPPPCAVAVVDWMKELQFHFPDMKLAHVRKSGRFRAGGNNVTCLFAKN